MGIMSDVIVPISELLQEPEDLGQSLIRQGVLDILDAVNQELVDLNLRAVYTLLIDRE
jgi:hypothetical protein